MTILGPGCGDDRSRLREGYDGRGGFSSDHSRARGGVALAVRILDAEAMARSAGCDGRAHQNASQRAPHARI